MMKYQVYDVKKQDYLQLIELWEQSVRATHDFLSDEEIDGKQETVNFPTGKLSNIQRRLRYTGKRDLG